MTTLDTPSGWHAFHVSQGPDLHSLRDLMECLERMPPWQYGFHVNPIKNDFATWIEDVFSDRKLAVRVRGAQTPGELREILSALGTPPPAVAERKSPPPSSASPPHPQRSPTVQVPAPIAPARTVIDAPATVGASASLIDDQAFGRLRDEYTGRNEQLYDRFDTVVQELKASLDDPMPEKYEKLAEQLTERAQELKLRMSALRKEGKDAFLPMLMLRPFAAKLSLAKVTRESADFERVRILLNQVEAEIAEVARIEPLDVRKEVERLAAS